MVGVGDLIVRKLQERTDISDLSVEPDAESGCLSIHYFDGPDFYSDVSVFDSCTSDEIKILLENFCSDYYVTQSWSVSCELSKLLAKHGKLVAAKVENILALDEANYFYHYPLHLAYLGSDPKWENYCIKCLDICQEDFRDGIFLACFYLNTYPIYCKLVECFEKWIEQDVYWGSGTGEAYALCKFIEKWDKTPDFNIHGKLVELAKKFDLF
ncbi:MAG: hypothetical protein RRY34_08920 [Victivallaceae bacterium]